MLPHLMVHLSKIYTRSGDDGSTGLGDGTRVPKHHLRIEAYGTVDETSSSIGVVLAGGLPERADAMLRQAQNDLFDVGADLSVPGTPGGDGEARLRVTASYVGRLEAWIDEVNEELEPLDSFVLPGGEPAAAALHVARTVCRRAERRVEALLHDPAERERVNPEALRYLNRLSDLLFVLARAVNDGGRKDVLWKPGASEEGGG
jgi:cob(I)alamin adenosyltransferase